MLRDLRRLAHNDGGAVAPTVAMSLVALIAAGGIAFDYARLASLDTELQGAADQAALAAASQLDGQAGACARAAAAASDLLANQTLNANDATASRAITVTNESTCDATGFVRFYTSYDSVNDTFGAEATLDADARVVSVQVNPREAIYALTPVVGAFRSGGVNARAVASLGSAICKVPPVMMCNPSEPATNIDVNYDFNPAEGQGLRLVIGDPDAPGNFGFLRTDAAGAKQVAKEIGYDNPPAGCMATNGVETEPGNMISVRAAFNTRFDISENGATTCPDAGTCSPSRNSRKDLVRNRSVAAPGACSISQNTSDNWHEASQPYRARNTTPLSTSNPMIPASGPNPAVPYPSLMGYPRDMCHALSVAGTCTNGIVGDGNWDIDAYFKVNYGLDHSAWVAQTLLDPAVKPVTRYDVYKWEMANPAVLKGINTPQDDDIYTAYSSPICRGTFPTGGITPGPGTPDRRRISVAVVNCHAQNLKGHETNVQVRKWMDVFLVEPAIQRGNGPNQRTTNGDIYVETIGVTSSGGAADNAVTRRDVPYLIR